MEIDVYLFLACPYWTHDGTQITCRVTNVKQLWHFGERLCFTWSAVNLMDKRVYQCRECHRHWSKIAQFSHVSFRDIETAYPSSTLLEDESLA